MRFHKEGYTSLALCILFIFVINALIQFYLPQANTFKWIIYTLSFLSFVAVIYFFRSPSIDVVYDETAILSPADGKITAIEEVDEPEFFKARGLKISVSISPLNVHVNRNPVKGIVKHVMHADNGDTAVLVGTGNDTTILYRQIKGFSSSRIVSYVALGDSVEQGAEFGFSKLGSRVDLYLPIGTKTDVDIDDIVKGGQTILARLKA